MVDGRWPAVDSQPTVSQFNLANCLANTAVRFFSSPRIRPDNSELAPGGVLQFSSARKQLGMNPDLSNLKELQAADREIARLAQEIASLPRRVAVIEAKLADSKARKEKAGATIKAGEAARRKFEAQILDLQQKISKYRDQMLAVKTNQEYKAITSEVEFAQQHIREAEDKILEGMVAAESLEKDLKKAEAELRTETAEVEKEKAEARLRTEIAEKEMAEWKSKRDQVRTAIAPDALRHYDRVLKLRGSALAEAVDHKCSACQVMLRPQVYNDVRTNEQFIICDSCHRILWYDPARDAQPVKEEAAVPAEAGPTNA
jgi:predicted  nucleic acid-binding Zn-ribbon protein